MRDRHSITDLSALGRVQRLVHDGDGFGAIGVRMGIDPGAGSAAPKIKACALLSQAHTLLRSGQVTQAQEAYRKSLAIQEEMGIPVLRPETLNGLADCLLSQGEVEKALALLEEAEDFFREVDQAGISETLVRQAEAHAVSGNLAEAQQTVQRCLATVEQPGSREEPAPETWWRAGRVLCACGNETQGQQMLDRADRLLNEQAAWLTDSDLRRSFLETGCDLGAPARAWGTAGHRSGPAAGLGRPETCSAPARRQPAAGRPALPPRPPVPASHTTGCAGPVL